MMPTDGESAEFKEWWNKHFDASETGRTRMMAAHAFEAGRALVRTTLASAAVEDYHSEHRQHIRRTINEQ